MNEGTGNMYKQNDYLSSLLLSGECPRKGMGVARVGRKITMTKATRSECIIANPKGEGKRGEAGQGKTRRKKGRKGKGLSLCLE